MKSRCVFGFVAALLALPLAAHEGHDHGDEKAALPNLGNLPQRLPDGVVFLPKSAQRQMAIRTQPLASSDLNRAIELSGQVVINPQRGGRVQAMLAGRVEARDSGLPVLGQAVKRGEVLASVVPAAGQIERADLAATMAELQVARELAEKRLSRLQALADTVPARDIEAAHSELSSLRARLQALGQGASGRDVLRAPVSGVIAAVHVVPGQVVDARELIFEIADPDSLHVEALAYDRLAATQIHSASVAVGDEALALEFLGAGQRLREQALPLLFGQRGPGMGLRLPLGQPVKIQVQLRSTAKGLAIPQQALVRSPANVAMVWVKTAPEHFTPKPVRVEPLDGQRVRVLDGLSEGDRLVVQGATLINQIR